MHRLRNGATTLPQWYTFHASTERDGWNSNETVLTTANVNQNQFGMRYSVPVNGEVYAEPLFVPQVNIPRHGLHNVLLVATEADSVYALQAETGITIWQTSYVNPPAVTTFPTKNCQCSNIAVQQGITGTPVIDPATLTAYFVSKTNDTSNGITTTHYRLHGISVATGQDIAPATDIVASVVASDGTIVALDPAMSIQRPGLTLSRGVVYVAFGSGADKQPLTTSGWVVAFNKKTLAQMSAFSDEKGASQTMHLWYGPTEPVRLGAIWMSGAAPAVDGGGNLYAQTGNGAFDGTLDFGQSVVKVSPDLSHVVDYFTPSQWLKQSNSDSDLSSAGPVILPETIGGARIVVAGGKSGETYLLNQDRLGRFNAKQDNVLSETMTNSGLWGTVAAYVGPDGNQYLIVPGGGPMTLWQVTQTATLSFVDQSSETFGTGDDSGSEPVISSNGTTPGSAIVWAYSRSGGNGPAQLTLRAFDATNLTKQLIELPYTNWMGGGELLTPAVANGLVFTAGEGTVSAYGLL
ncbi:MAG: hypothetical protein IAI50_12395 [Candidatus Eremiobacteraeota bacterium]|nr:hypothetical protein [Candidatus Eremiobacteraeota bacterium]